MSGKDDYLKRLSGAAPSANDRTPASAGASSASGGRALDRLAGGDFHSALSGSTAGAGRRQTTGGGSALDRLAGGTYTEKRSSLGQMESRTATGVQRKQPETAPYAGMSGEQIYATRKAQEEEAKSDYWSNALKLLGNAATQALRAQSGAWVKPEDQLATARESAAAAQNMREAKARQKEASKAIEWDGRQELLQELEDLDNQLAWATDLEQTYRIEERRQEARKKLAEGDIAAGNGERVYGGVDEARRFSAGTAERIGSGIVAAGGAIGRAVAQSEAIKTATNQDQFIIDALSGRGEENIQRLRDTLQMVQSEEFNAPFEKVLDTAQRLDDKAAAHLQAVKEGKSALGKAFVDIGENVIEMGFDAGVGALTGGGSLGSMFVRVMGSGVLEARKDGADPTQQLLYGVAKGGIEVLTEKLFDGVAGIYGAGAADEITKKLISRMTENKVGRAMLVVLSNAVEEGGEEVLSDLLSPFAEKIYKQDSLGQLYRQIDPSEVMYDFLIGAAIGGLGSVVSAAKGGIRQDLIDMDVMDAGGNVSDQVDDAMRILSGRASAEDVQARQARAQERLAMRGLDAQGNVITFQQRVAEDLESRGYDKAAAQEVAELVVRQATGEELSEQDQTKLRSEQVRTTMRSLEEKAETKLNMSSAHEQAIIDGFANEQETTAGTYAAAMREAYRYGQMGLSLTQAFENSAYSGDVLPINYRHAFQLGAGQTVSESTGGRESLLGSLAMLGRHAETAADAIEAGQDPDAYAAAMDFAANYAANGGDVLAYVQAARNGEIPGTNVGMLSDEQVQVARQIGAELQEAKEKETQAKIKQRARISEQAEALLAEENPELGELNEAIQAATDYGKGVQAQFDAVMRELEQLPEGSEAYQEALQRANELQTDMENTEETLQQLKDARREMKAKAQRKKGTVSYDGGTIQGRSYPGVDRSKLTKMQHRTVKMVESLADVVNVDYVFFNGPANMGGAYVKGGVVYVNMNSEMGLRGVARSITAATLSHELTHFTQEYAPEEYADLRDYIVKEIMKKSPAEFDRLVKQQMRWEPKLSYDEAVNELVANGCQTMLGTTQAVKQIVREHLNWAENFAERIHEIGEQLKAAFEGVDVNEDAALFDAARFLQESFDEIQTRWDKAVAAATRNYNAEQTVNKAKASREAASETSAAESESAESSKNSAKQRETQLMAIDEQGNVIVDGEVTPLTVQNTLTAIFNGETEGRDFTFPIFKNTPQVYLDYCNFTDRSLVMHAQKAWEAMRDDKPDYHDLKVQGMMRIISRLFTPENIILQTKGKNAGHYIAIIADENGEATAAVEFDNERYGKGAVAGENGRYNVLITAYDKLLPGMPFETFSDYVNSLFETDGNYVVYDRERDEKYEAPEEWGLSDPLSVLPSGASSDATIAQPAEERKPQNDAEATALASSEDDAPDIAESTTQSQVWTEDLPQRTQYGFKLMNVDEKGLPHAMFIDAANPYELGQWYTADSPKMENLISLEPGYAYLVDENDVADMASRKKIRKVDGSFRSLPGVKAINDATAAGKRWMVVDQYADGSKSVHNVGINGSGSVSTYALRPGIHAVDIPSMSHIGSKSEGSKKIDTRRPNQAWYLIEYPVDQDYNQEAYSHETKDIREHLPTKGWYSYQTNSGAEARQHWFITGGMKVVGMVSEADARRYAREHGFEEDLPWKNGKTYSEDSAIDLDKYIRTTKAMPTPSKKEMRQRIESGAQLQAWDNDAFEDLRNRASSVNSEWAEARKALSAIQSSDEFNTWMDRIVADSSPETLAAYKKWEDKSGLGEIAEKEARLRKEREKLNKELDEAIKARDAAARAEAIEKSGLSEADYDRKQAVKEFGYTPYFYDAGYILPNGKMLNFSGEKGKHYGTRGQDHRAIGILFDDVSGSEAMVKFMGEGNIRIMAESPGVDIANGAEPTAEQYRTMRSFIQSVRGEEYFNVDLTDERGNTVGNLEYEGTIRPDRVINDIKHYFQTGEIRDNGVSAFLQTWDEGEVYNHRATVSEETIDKWLTGSWFGSNSNPNYAQAYIAYMTPSQYLRVSTIYDEPRVRAEAAGRTMEWVKDVSEGQPIQLKIDTAEGKVFDHEGRHRMVVLERNGVKKVPVLLFDMDTKYSKEPLAELRLEGQNFNGMRNYASTTVRDLVPLNRAHRDEILEKFSKPTKIESMSEQYDGYKTAQFQQWYDYSKSFTEQIEDYKNGQFPNYDTLIVRGTPKVFQKIGLNALPMTYGTVHLQDVLDGTKIDHDFGEALLKQLPEKLEEPIAIFTSASQPNTSIIALVDLVYNGKHIITPVLVDGFGQQNGIRIDSNAITTAHTRGNAISGLLRDAIKQEAAGKVGVFYYDKAKATGLLNGSELQLLGRKSDANGFIHSIRDPNSPVKPKINSVTESKQFKRWFGKSKVVNPDGTPKVVYHQTGANFTVFNTDNPVAGANDSETPNGIFFKDNDHDIGLGGSIQMPVYLSIQRPLQFADRKAANAWYQKHVPGYRELQDEMNSKLDPIDKAMNDLENEMFADGVTDEQYAAYDAQWNDMLAQMSEIENDYRGRLRELLDDYFLRNDSGYDGIELDYDGHRYVNGKRENVHTYIVFKNTQVKSATDNIGLFDPNNPDIRYQQWDNTDSDTAKEAQGREIAYARLQAENAALHDAVEGLKKLTGQYENTIGRLERKLSLTKTPSVRVSDAQKMARSLLKEYSSKADYVSIQRQLKELGDYILQTPTAELNEEEIKNRARAIASELIDSASTIADYGGELDTYREIAKSIKGAKLSIDKAFLGELNGYDAFRKANFGNFTLAQREQNSRETRKDYMSVEQFYIDLQHTYGEAYFPNVANEGEQIRVIADMFDRAKGDEVNPFEQYTGEATEYLANKIVFDTMNGMMRPKEPTTMDKQKARQDALKERIAELKAEGKLNEKEAQRLRETVYDLTVQLDKAESRYKSLSIGAETRIAQVQREGRSKAAEIRANERAKANEQIQALKEHYQDMAKRARQGRQNTASRNKIRKLINELNAKLAKPSENRYIPKELVQLTIDTLEMVDTDTGRGVKVLDKLEDIRAMYERYKSDERYAVVYDDVTAQMLNNLANEIRGTKLVDMNERQLETVYQTLRSLSHVITTAVNVKIAGEERNAFELSREMTAETRDIVKAQTSWLKNKWLVSHLRADVMFDRFGGFKKNSAWSQVSRMLNEGQLKQTKIKMDLSRPFSGLVNDQKAMQDFTGTDFWGKIQQDKLVDIGLKDAAGQPILVTHDIMVGIYMDLLNEDNRRHFIRGGKTIPALQEFYSGRGNAWGAGARKAVGIAAELSELTHDLAEAKRAGYGEWAEETQNRINELMLQGEQYADSVKAAIEEKMTDFDRQWVEATQQLMDQDSKRYLNETTMEVYGIEKARVDHYFPITVDPAFLTANFDSVSRDMSLENAGFMKERVTSSKPTLALGTFTVDTRQIDRVAQYCGLMPVIRNFNKILSKTDFGYQDSLKDALRGKFGEDAMNWIDGLMADLQGARDAKRDDMGLSQLLGKLRGNLAQTSLTLNPRVALAQAASYPTAAAELGWGPLAKALAHGGKSNRMISRADQELIAKWSPLLWYRMQGYSTQELGDIKNNNSATAKIWKKLRWATGWIQYVDGATVGRLWYAAEYWVQDNQPSLEKGTDAYYEAVAQKFNAVVEKTQPNYTPMQRATILRNPKELYKTLFMFMTQRLQNFNILYDATASYQKQRADFALKKNGVTREDVAEAKQTMVRAVCSQLAQAAVYVGVKLLADVLLHSMKKWRDDDTGELTAESVSLQLLNNYVDALAGSFLLGSELYSGFKAMTGQEKWYGLSVNGVDSVNDLVEDVVALANEKDAGKRKAKILNVAKSLSQLMGIPLNNGIKIGQSLAYWIEDAVNGELGSFNAGYEKTKAQKTTSLIRALESGNKTDIKSGTDAFDSEKDALSAVKTQLKKDLTDGSRTKSETVTLLTRAGMSREDADKLVNEWKETADFVSAHKAEYEQYDLTVDQAKYYYSTVKRSLPLANYAKQVQEYGLTFVKEYYGGLEKDGWKETGLSISQYADFKDKAAKCKGTDLDGDGKTDSGSVKEQIMEVINRLPVSKDVKDAIYLKKGWSEASLQYAPWH